MSENYQSEYYQKNRDAILAKTTEYYKNNRESIIAKNKKYYQKNRDAILAKKKKQRDCQSEESKKKRVQYDKDRHIKNKHKRKKRSEDTKKKAQTYYQNYYRNVIAPRNKELFGDNRKRGRKINHCCEKIKKHKIMIDGIEVTFHLPIDD
tara:strand:- start:506 stop:955 length:450 start_codon:yes stop_codon:yes gene_type:complete